MILSGILRLQLLVHQILPYLFAGAAATREFDLSRVKVALKLLDVKQEIDVVVPEQLLDIVEGGLFQN